MVKNADSSSIMGTEIEILRERFFIDHVSTDTRKLERELTMISRTDNKNGVDNIFIKVSKLLPNLKIFDSDGTVLPLITNKYTVALIEQTISDSRDLVLIESLTSLLKDIRKYTTFLLWIKLPHDKKFYPNDSRVITMKYDANKENSTNSFDLEFLSESNHEVFYIITPPKDYEFDKKKIIINEGSEEKLEKDYSKGWKNEKGDPFYFNEYSDSITIRVNPRIQAKTSLNYSFTPSKKAKSFVKGILTILIIAPLVTMLSKACYPMNENCSTIPGIFDLDLISTKILEIDIAVMGAALIIAGLIHNLDVREKFKWWFFIPITLAIIAILLKP